MISPSNDRHIPAHAGELAKQIAEAYGTKGHGYGTVERGVVVLDGNGVRYQIRITRESFDDGGAKVVIGTNPIRPGGGDTVEPEPERRRLRLTRDRSTTYIEG